jgi:DNA repair protein RecN (Recombination protein N)
MLARLIIRDIVLIDRLDVAVDAGLTVLTGETGAGKSILLDAFALALGGRGDGGLVREGAAQGQVTAVFDVDLGHPARQLAAASDLEVEGDLILRRVQLKDGRTRAFVNDQPVSVQILKALGAQLVEIHGQHDDRALIDPAIHRALLDAFAGLGAEVEAVATAFERWRKAETERDRHRARVEKARADQDYLRHASEELTRLAPEAGEEAALAERRQAMLQSEKVASDLKEAHELFSGPHSALPSLSSAFRRLERRREQAPALLTRTTDAFDVAMSALDEVQVAIEAAMRAADFDPRELERIEERLFALRAAARKHNVTAEALPALAARFVADLAALDAGEEQLAALERAAADARMAYAGAAATLSARRAAAAAELDAAVNAELPPLKLERARFITQVVTDAAMLSAEGSDRVEFWVMTNPGTRPGPMMKVASGGELSRFMLALKVVLADRGSAPTLVFDEIDTGVGGAVADAIGQRLHRLAARVQVLSVTHAPQVAARARQHLLIAKEALDAGGEEARMATRVAPLAAEARREEIARMLSGAVITPEARAAADTLLAVDA